MKYIFDKPMCEEGSISINEDPSCEHCGYLEEFDAMICDGSTWWCVECWKTEHDLPFNIFNQIKEKVKAAKLKFYNEQIKKEGTEDGK